MRTSQNGINLIKQFEGCRLTAYKPVKSETYYTIGYGHYGSDVREGMTITQAIADYLLAGDLVKFEQKVLKYDSKYHWNQNEFDAMVSFAYNLGSIDGLTNYGSRTKEQIAQKMMLYNKAGGNVLAGLTKRRKLERDLFLLPCNSTHTSTVQTQTVSTDTKYYPAYKGGSNALVDALRELKIDSSFNHRKNIAFANGIVSSTKYYTGTYEQNLAIFLLLKEGKLKQA